jgi:hypothetical protein
VTVPEGRCARHALVKHLTFVSMLQARLSFTHIGGPQPGRRGTMDAGDADGADALLSLAKLANAESSGMMDEDMTPMRTILTRPPSLPGPAVPPGHLRRRT